jgi:magnesium and cobalt exporter, CNNM family
MTRGPLAGARPEPPLIDLLIILALVIANGIFAGAEIAVIALRKTRAQELLEEGAGGARAVLALKDQPERFLATVQIGITVVGATAAAFGGAQMAERVAPLLEPVPWLREHSQAVALALVITLISFLSIVVGELVPKSLALRAAEGYALLVARPLLTLSYVARPAVWLLSACANLLLKPFGDKTTFTETRHSIEEIQELVDEATKAGTIPPAAAEIASRALDLPDLTALDVMVPRQDVIMIPRSSTPDELRHVLREHGYNRLPVYEDRVDNVVGYVSTRDFLAQSLDQKPLALEAVLRPPFFVPEFKRAVELLQDMRRQHKPFAIVIDELGGVAGIVTIEDLIEELVGDIVSEHTQRVPELIEREADGGALVQGTAPIREINRELELELPDDGDWTTIAGLALALAGRVPQIGDVLVTDDGVTLEIVDATARRVRLVRVRQPEPSKEQGEERALPP